MKMYSSELSLQNYSGKGLKMTWKSQGKLREFSYLKNVATLENAALTTTNLYQDRPYFPSNLLFSVFQWIRLSTC